MGHEQKMSSFIGYMTHYMHMYVFCQDLRHREERMKKSYSDNSDQWGLFDEFPNRKNAMRANLLQ